MTDQVSYFVFTLKVIVLYAYIINSFCNINVSYKKRSYIYLLVKCWLFTLQITGDTVKVVLRPPTIPRRWPDVKSSCDSFKQITVLLVHFYSVGVAESQSAFLNHALKSTHTLLCLALSKSWFLSGKVVLMMVSFFVKHLNVWLEK